ncbi:Pimeloyl-ACP methyl ester carboxylesterase [Amycolatopsis xylanica]|uniref:Pimeloyl-ACP methyl ester carboxylesterase n=1 Tax=Amycolatopsis xylanica TaxID=589385 RepID=A0A1H3HLF9_9PSEU|nr:alpha/beta hydrolase [Amycolatopsis xylanica]SDY15634.1 Pimeloyl-ACP methyl ester carboxylesterase [Amycolatopsis xylanica]
MKLYREDEGTGRPLLFLHGWGTSGRVWGAQLPEFIRDHRVVTLDLRGCGRSPRPSQGNTIDANVEDLAEVASELGKPVIVGSSIGGLYATELALRHPDLVERVVTVGGPAYWPSTGMLDKVLALREALVTDRAGTLAGWLPNWFAPRTSPALIDWTLRQVLDSGVYIDELFTDCTRYDPRPRLADLSVPITYVHGELDAEIPLEVPRACAALTPGAELIVIDGSGHLPHQERPLAFNAVLRKVLGED